MVAPLSTPDPVRFKSEKQSIHNSLHMGRTSPASLGPVSYMSRFFIDSITYDFLALIMLGRHRLLRFASEENNCLFFVGFVGTPP